jgi:predicted nucleotidyltransferase
MLTPKQIKIFEAFLHRPYREMTYREIKEYSKEKSNSAIQKGIAKFVGEQLVEKREVGNMVLYSLNLENSKVFSYFDILIQEKLPKVTSLSIKRIREEVADIGFISIVIFGSYAENRQSGKSDLDVALFVSSPKDKRNCELALKSAELKSILPLDAHTFTREEMLQMLRDKEENLGKQIARNHLAIHNPAIFYSILREGIENGFKITYQAS